MRLPGYPWGLASLFTGRPTVGGLMDLCEENFAHLLRLAPQLRGLQGRYLSPLPGEMDLHLEILEQTPYTSLVHLTYYFDRERQPKPDPDAIIRVYHDSRQAEVIKLAQRALTHAGPQRPTLKHKWQLNLFLSKWLSYCVQQGHLFQPAQRIGAPLETPSSLAASF